MPLSAVWRAGAQDGNTWSEPTQLDQFLGDKGHAAAGPGVGIQLTQGKHKGRLLFIGHRGAYIQDSVWFSDDGGKTYSTSDTILQEMVRRSPSRALDRIASVLMLMELRWRVWTERGSACRESQRYYHRQHAPQDIANEGTRRRDEH